MPEPYTCLHAYANTINACIAHTQAHGAERARSDMQSAARCTFFCCCFTSNTFNANTTFYGGLLKILASQRLGNECTAAKKAPAWKTSIKTADKQWNGPSQVNDNLNFFLIYFHVLCLPFFSSFLFTPTLLFHLSQGEPLLFLFLPLLPPEAHYLGTERDLGCFQRSKNKKKKKKL